MDNDSFISLVLTVALMIGAMCGYAAGKHNAAVEIKEHCDKIGKIIVRDKIYECKEQP